MHELSIASAIVENVLEFVRAQRTGRVVEVRLLVGELLAVEAEQLRFCYTAVTKETVIEDSQLAIDRIEACVACGHCAYHGRPQYWDDGVVHIATLQCPACGQAAEATAGHECAIKAIRYVN